MLPQRWRASELGPQSMHDLNLSVTQIDPNSTHGLPPARNHIPFPFCQKLGYHNREALAFNITPQAHVHSTSVRTDKFWSSHFLEKNAYWPTNFS